MRSTWCIFKRELGAYFKSPIAYIVLAVFVVLSGLLFFTDSFFAGGVASLQGLFLGAFPLVFVIFAPAITMRLLAEERGSGTIEILLTMPVRDREVVFGKYLAAVVLLLVALVTTLPFAASVYYLGELDWGATISGYLGAFLLGSLYLALGLVSSSLAKDQVVAFILGILFCFVTFAMLWWADVEPLRAFIKYVSPDQHYRNLVRGFIELRGVVYFASAICVALIVAIQAVEARKWG